MGADGPPRIPRMIRRPYRYKEDNQQADVCILCGMPAMDDKDMVLTVRGKHAHRKCVNRPVETPGVNYLTAPDDGVYAG